MLVHFLETRDTATGVRVPIVGRLRFRATLARVIAGTPDEEVLPAPFSVPLDADGKASVTLPATGLSWAWEVSLHGNEAGWGPVYVTVPEGDECDWPDLVRVDPATLDPAEAAVPAWEAAVEQVQAISDGMLARIATELNAYLLEHPPTQGDPGPEVELRTTATHVQWRVVGDPVWIDLVPLAALRGDDGLPVELRTNATHVQWRVAGGLWTDLILLSSLKGAKGDAGPAIELTTSATHVQWRVAGTLPWTDLILLSALKGSKGDAGTAVELQKTATHVQWRLVGGVWANLIALTELKGVKGDAGPAVELQKSATHVQWRVSGTLPWTDLVPLADLKGVKGDPAPNPALTAAATTLAPGASATAVLTGVYPNLTVTFGIPQGIPGTPATQVEMQASATHLQWRLVGGTWADLVTLEALKGGPGVEGPSGQAGSYVGVTTIPDATYAPIATDVGKLLRLTSATPVTITLPADADAAIPVGKTIDFAQRGAGSITFVAGAGVSPLIVADTAVTRKLGSMATAIKEGANLWAVAGDLA